MSYQFRPVILSFGHCAVMANNEKNVIPFNGLWLYSIIISTHHNEQPLKELPPNLVSTGSVHYMWVEHRQRVGRVVIYSCPYVRSLPSSWSESSALMHVPPNKLMWFDIHWSDQRSQQQRDNKQSSMSLWNFAFGLLLRWVVPIVNMNYADDTAPLSLDGIDELPNVEIWRCGQLYTCIQVQSCNSRYDILNRLLQLSQWFVVLIDIWSHLHKWLEYCKS